MALREATVAILKPSLLLHPPNASGIFVTRLIHGLMRAAVLREIKAAGFEVR